MRSYPIWCVVDTDAKKTANFGAGQGFKQTILVGTSSKNSHELATIEVKNVGKGGFTLMINDTPLIAVKITDGKKVPVKWEEEDATVS